MLITYVHSLSSYYHTFLLRAIFVNAKFLSQLLFHSPFFIPLLSFIAEVIRIVISCIIEKTGSRCCQFYQLYYFSSAVIIDPIFYHQHPFIISAFYPPSFSYYHVLIMTSASLQPFLITPHFSLPLKKSLITHYRAYIFLGGTLQLQ